MADLPDNDALRLKLQGLTSNRTLNFPGTLTLNSWDQGEIASKSVEFIQKRTDAHIAEFLYESFSNGDYVNSLYTLLCINKRKAANNSYNEFFSNLFDFHFILHIGTWHSAIQLLKEKNVEGFLH